MQILNILRGVFLLYDFLDQKAHVWESWCYCHKPMFGQVECVMWGT